MASRQPDPTNDHAAPAGADAAGADAAGRGAAAPGPADGILGTLGQATGGARPARVQADFDAAFDADYEAEFDVDFEAEFDADFDAEFGTGPGARPRRAGSPGPAENP